MAETAAKETTSISPVPRPADELEMLERIWATPRGWRVLSAVNNTVVGLIYMGAAFLFSIAYAMSTDSHVRVDLIYNERTRGRLAWVDAIGLTLLTLPTLVWLSWGLWGHFMESVRTGERSGSGGWNPVVWPFKLVMFVGFLVFAIQVGAEIAKRFMALAGAPLEAQKVDEHAV